MSLSIDDDSIYYLNFKYQFLKCGNAALLLKQRSTRKEPPQVKFRLKLTPTSFYYGLDLYTTCMSRSVFFPRETIQDNISLKYQLIHSLDNLLVVQLIITDGRTLSLAIIFHICIQEQIQTREACLYFHAPSRIQTVTQNTTTKLANWHSLSTNFGSLLCISVWRPQVVSCHSVPPPWSRTLAGNHFQKQAPAVTGFLLPFLCAAVVKWGSGILRKYIYCTHSCKHTSKSL